VLPINVLDFHIISKAERIKAWFQNGGQLSDLLAAYKGDCHMSQTSERTWDQPLIYSHGLGAERSRGKCKGQQQSRKAFWLQSGL